jgi:hypothetical protein
VRPETCPFKGTKEKQVFLLFLFHFLSMYPKELVGLELFKVFNDTLTHHGFQYREGVVNRLKEPFAETGSCVPGGFYFTTKEHISDFLDFGVRVRRVHVPFDHPECRVVEDPAGGKYRTNMLMLGEKCTVEKPFSMVPSGKLLGWANSTGRIRPLEGPRKPIRNFHGQCFYLGFDGSPRVVEEHFSNSLSIIGMQLERECYGFR